MFSLEEAKHRCGISEDKQLFHRLYISKNSLRPMTKGEIYLVVLSIQLFILVVIFFVVRVVLNPPKNIIKSFIIVDGNLYARCQQGHIALIKPPQPICIKDIVRIKLNQTISINGNFAVVVETKDGKRVTLFIGGTSPMRELQRLREELLASEFDGEIY